MGILGSPNGSKPSRPATRRSLTLAMSEVIPVLNNHADSLQALDRAAGLIADRVTMLEGQHKQDSVRHTETLEVCALLNQRMAALESAYLEQGRRSWWKRVWFA